MRILVFGDSIAYGAWDREGGWVQRLRKFLDEHYNGCIVYNLGISSNTSLDLLKRFEFETKQRLEEDDETIIIFSIGINDSMFILSENKNKIGLEKFKENIQELISIAQKFSSKIIFVGLTPVDEMRTTPIPWDNNKIYRNQDIQRFDKTIKNVCKENGIYFIELFEKLKGLKSQELLADGLHPNSGGHEKIFEFVRDFLVKNNII